MLNLVLLGLVVAFALPRPGSVPPAGPVAVTGPFAPVTNPPAVTVPLTARSEPAPFRWHQLDAIDYHDYVKNLRAIGCPEPSVRAIVTADVAAVYGQRQRRLEKSLADLKTGSWSAQLGSFNQQQNLQAQLQALPGEMSAMIDDLLGIKPRRAATPPATPPVAVPLALQEFDATAVKMAPDQLEALKQVRQLFLDKMGATPPDPHDPEAVQRWQAAQAEADDQLQAFLGSEVYQNLQLQAFANRQAQKAGVP